MRLSVNPHPRNYVSTDITLHLVIYVTFCIILFKSQFLRKPFYIIINAECVIYMSIVFVYTIKKQLTK